jgi:two-component system LytT family sensor kinase
MKHPARIALLFGALTLVALLFASQLYVVYRAESMPIAFATIFLLQLSHWYLWGLAGPLAWSFATRWPVRARDRWPNSVRLAAVGVVLGLLIVMAYGAVYYTMVRMPVTRQWFTEIDRGRTLFAIMAFCFSLYFHVELLTYAGIVAVAHAVRSGAALRAREREALELSSQLANARLQVLTAQLQPHFLFNTLHTIGSLILQRNTEQAMQILAELGELLRLTLHRQNVSLIPLRDEIEHLSRYLRIEETRFRDRLTVRWDLEPAALEYLVPPLILQPLVENALKHGVSARVEPGTLDVQASTSDGRLRVSIYNDGPLLPQDWSGQSSFGFGLRNVHERLATVGPGCVLAIENAHGRGVRAAIELTRD